MLKQLVPELKHIVFFEPQSQYIKALQSLELTNVTKVVYGCALGIEEGSFDMKGGTASASLFDSDIAQSYYFPDSLNNTRENVSVNILDKIYADDKLPCPDLIKIDVQGYELNVLKGAIATLSKTKYIVIELSFRSFYKGQPELWEILKFLHENHFVWVAHGYEWRYDNNPSELLQIDGIFANTQFIKQY